MNPQRDNLRADFRNAMRRVASTVSVITCKADGHRFGVTATSLISVSVESVTLLVCINQQASLHAPLSVSGRFCVNLLSSNQAAIAQAFAGSVSGAARFEHGQWDESCLGLPALRGAQANLFCTLVETVSRGTHSIFLGDVDQVRLSGEVAPLTYHDGDYSYAARLQGMPAPRSQAI